jgi:hypothetical protein
VRVPVLLVFTVTDRPRHVGADRAMTALLGAFSFAPVVYRQPREQVVTFHAEIPDVQLDQLPAAVAALCALDDVASVAVVTLTGTERTASGPATHEGAELPGGDGESVGRQC